MARDPKRRALARTLVYAWIVISGATSQLDAHDSPLHVIDAITHRIESDRNDPELYVDRAFEYMSLSEWSSAERDFKQALAIDSENLAALQGLSESLMRQERANDAIAAAEQGLRIAPNRTRQSSFLVLIAQGNECEGRFATALDCWRQALEGRRPQIDWFLGEARCLQQLGRFQEASASLSDAMKRNPSIVLKRHWISSLVYAGEYEQALKQINLALAESKWKSHWLLLRAKIYHEQGRLDEQRLDAQQALQEISSRLDSSQPDPYLEKQASEARLLMEGEMTGESIHTP